MVKFKTMDANEAVSLVAYKFSEVCGIYPITPASPMASYVDRMSSCGEKNFFDNTVKVIEMQSEAGAVSLVHGALQSGALATTFTASQGLLLMIPTLYKMAGELLPAVIHVTARSLSTHALSIFGDHQDVYACLNTGACMLSSSSVEEAYYMAIISHLSSIAASLPIINFFDGFRTSHEIDKIRITDMEKIASLIDKDKLDEFRKKALNANTPNSRGMAENDDIYFQHTEARNINYINSVNYIAKYMEKISKLCDMDIRPYNYYGSNNAKYVIVAMGSVVSTIREVVGLLNKDDDCYGVVDVHMFRPFSADYLVDVVPDSVRKIAVLDRSKSFGSNGEQLYLDVLSAFYCKDVKIYGGRYGLSSKNTTPNDIKAIYDAMINNTIHNNFTVGINDDVTNLSLKYLTDFHLPLSKVEAKIYGYGSDGMVSTIKDLIKIVGDNTDNYVQGYFQYDSKKSGGVTRCHVRMDDRPILKTYYVEQANFIVISKDNYIYRYDILDEIADYGTLLLNTSLGDWELIKSLPNKVKHLIAVKKINFYVIDASKIAGECGLGNKIGTCMERCIFHLFKIIDDDVVRKIMYDTNHKRFIDKGDDVVAKNNMVVDKSLSELRKIDISDSFLDAEFFDNVSHDFNTIINNLKGDSLPVSAFLDKSSGIFSPGSSKYEKREVASLVPCWIKENCIQCNQCSFVCPHAVIRPFLLEDRCDNIETVSSMFPKNLNYTIGVSYKDCTGCGLCYNTCPGKMGKKAIKMVDYNKKECRQEIFDYLLSNNVNDKYKFKNLNVKSEGFIAPKFEFNGSCSGCGETPYLKNLTQVFGEKLYIANATGCSSIYGGSVPSTPYSIPWASSLFEDNSEYGLGIKKGLDVRREKIAYYMQQNLDKEYDLFNKWLNNRDDYELCLEVYNNIDYNRHKYLQDLKGYILPNVLWIVGGDGFAYDIGYGGLDHVLSRNDDVNILVLDTEVYSNTGGQTSKSSNFGAVAAFSSDGKRSFKKDLARIAMCYPHVYVACCNIGYNKEQYIKALLEAANHKGPSIIIAYSPCIEHGIRRGMSYSMMEGELATKCGYFPIFRYNPDKDLFTMDSKNVDFSLYEDFLNNENRFVRLKSIDRKSANYLLNTQKEWAIKRYNYYNKMDSDN